MRRPPDLHDLERLRHLPDVAVAEGRISVPVFDVTQSNQPAKLALSHGGTIVRVQGGDAWAVTRQQLTRGTGSFSFELIGDKSGDEISCFGVVHESHIGALPLAMHEVKAPAGSCYLRSYNGKVADALREAGALLKRGTITHSYPHSWRSKAPLIFRNTPQWFISMDTNDLRQ